MFLLCSICNINNLDHKPESLCFAVMIYSLQKIFESRVAENSIGETYSLEINKICKELIKDMKKNYKHLPVFFEDIVC